MTNHGRYGARPPAWAAWQSGKTAATIAFVREANLVLSAGTLAPDDRERLASFVSALIRGDAALTESLTPAEYLERYEAP